MQRKSNRKSTLSKVAILTAVLILLAPAAKSLGSAETPPAPVAPAAWQAAPAPPEPPRPPEPPQRHHSRGWLGVFLSDEEGVRITGVREGSPAEKAGLQAADRILEFDGKPVETTRDLHRIIRELEPGDNVEIRISRDGEEETVRATLGERDRDWHFSFQMPDIDLAPFAPYIEMARGSRNYIGVHIQPMTDELREYFKAPRGQGLLISKVVNDTPARRAGLAAGDIIIRVNGNDVAHPGDIRHALADREPGDMVPIRIVRDGLERTIDVEVAARPGDLGYFHDHDFDCDFDGGDGNDTGDGAMILECIREAMAAARGSLELTREIYDEIRSQALGSRREDLDSSRLELNEIRRQIYESMRNAQESSRRDVEEIRRQIHESMEEAHQAMRELEEARLGQAEDRQLAMARLQEEPALSQAEQEEIREQIREAMGQHRATLLEAETAEQLEAIEEGREY